MGSNGATNHALADAIRLMERVRDVPPSVREHLAREQRRRAVARIVETMQKCPRADTEND